MPQSTLENPVFFPKVGHFSPFCFKALNISLYVLNNFKNNCEIIPLMKRILLIILLALSQFGNAQDLYDVNTLREITIKFYDPDYHQTLIDWFHSENNSRLLATLEMDGTLYDSVGVRYKGNISFILAELSDTPKFPLNIDMNEYVEDQNLMGYDKLKLGNLFTDPTFVREVIAYSIYRKYLPAPRCNLIRVNIGVVGEEATYHGVYSNSESINKDFLKHHYDWKHGPLVKCDPNPQDEELACDNSGLGNGSGGEQVIAFPDLVWYGPDSCQYFANYEMKTDYGWEDLVEFIDVLNNNESQLYGYLNIDRVLWHMAVSTVISNKDTYYGVNIKNYYLYKHKDSLWHIMPWDVNECFGGIMGTTNEGAVYDVLQWFEPNEPNRPLVWQILEDERYFKQYFAHIRTVIEENYSVENITNQAYSIQDLIEQAVLDGPYNRFPVDGLQDNVENDMTYPELDWLASYAGIIPTINTRLEYLNDHPEVMKVPPTLMNTVRSIEEPEEGQDVWVTAEVTNATQVDLMITTHREYASYFEPIEMYDDGLNNDGIAGDGVYGALVPFQGLNEEIKYYVRAQNSDAMILEPRRAEYEFFEYKIGAMSPTSEDGVVINEFMASNDNSVTDQDGEYDDWIELYNNSTEGIDLSGYYLTDDGTNPTKWSFPDGTSIEADGYLIVWADNDTDQGGLHANFKLSRSGESITLSNAIDTSIVDYVDYQEQTTDISYGRFPNGVGDFQIMDIVTFNGDNSITNNTNEILNNRDDIKIYPNPAKDYISIAGDLEQIISIEIHDATGRLVYQLSNPLRKRIPIAYLSSGLYIVSFSTNEGVRLRKLLVNN